MARPNWKAILLRDNARLLRFTFWALAMCVAGLVVGSYWPSKVLLVPCCFVCLMVPSVLLPLQGRPQPEAR